MSRPVIQLDGVSKRYRLGAIGGKTLGEEVARGWAKLRKKPNPLAKVDATCGIGSTTEVYALRDVSLEIARGEILGVIGGNGAGKSTLLKILSRITAPSAGEVRVAGSLASLLEVGTGFHPDLTGRENTYLNGAILGMRRKEIAQRFDEIVDFAEIERFIDTPVKRYSSGMYVRLAFAVAAHLEPDVLLVDEVLAVGDASFQKKCLGKMGAVASEGRTVLFVSHNMASLAAICQTCLVLEHGSEVFRGDIRAGIDFYLDSAGSEGSSVVYDGNAEKGIQFKSSQVANAAGEVLSVFSLAEPVVIRLEYEIPRPLKHAQVVCHLWNSRHVHVLASADVDARPDLLDGRSAGRYVAEVVVPPSLLGIGTYHVTLACGVPNLELIDEREGPSFEISAIHSHASEWSTARKDVVVATPLEWRTAGPAQGAC